MEVLNANDWFVGIATGILSAAIFGGAAVLVRRILSWRGPFAGHYLALNRDPDRDIFLVEHVRSRQAGGRLAGSIRSVVFLDYRESSERPVEKDAGGCYRFTGFIEDRVVVVSYRTRRKEQLNAGAIALLADSSGASLRGVWTGFAGERICSSSCVWIRIPVSFARRWKRTQLVETARAYIKQKQYPDMDFGIGIAAKVGHAATFSQKVLYKEHVALGMKRSRKKKGT